MSIRRLLAGKLYPTIFSKRSITDSAGAYLPRKGKSYITHLPTNSKLKQRTLTHISYGPYDMLQMI